MKTIFGMFFVFLSVTLFADGPIDVEKIQNLIEVFSTGDRYEIVNQLSYPIRRQYPLPAIHNSSEALAHFDDLFDSNLLKMIQNSKAKDDWQLVGWRGYIFLDGALWLNFDYHIYAINYQTKKEGEAWKALVDTEKLELPVELRDFDTPVSRWTTQDFIVRVDRIHGKDRLVLWKVSDITKPYRVLSNGVENSYGTIGTYNLDWNDGDLTYRVEEGQQYIGEIPSLYVFDQKSLADNSETNPIMEQKATKYFDK